MDRNRRVEQTNLETEHCLSWLDTQKHNSVLTFVSAVLYHFTTFNCLRLRKLSNNQATASFESLENGEKIKKKVGCQRVSNRRRRKVTRV
ncbi:unnamed protein product [Thlaspi arvense]|uniref:Uncharacterized protein n=1 Tax=Thlaspi arvense TaxID=13288 RepID=A0AAU9S750_THLAR|nr:unnamed protein product [Thlaspi arvense]